MHHQPIEPSSEDAYYLSQAGGGEAQDEATTAALDPLGDVFGSSAPAEHQVAHAHPSDMPRLQTEHSTAGYREAISVAKEATMQAGFDEGFGLGATIGLRAGQLLGMLQGISDAVKGQANGTAVAAQKLLAEAQLELSVGRIFDPAYWAPDGNWTYEVTPAPGDELLFPDVADAHPLIRKWKAIVDDQVKLWKIDKAILDDEMGPQLAAMVDEVVDEAPVSSAAPTAAKKPLDW